MLLQLYTVLAEVLSVYLMIINIASCTHKETKSFNGINTSMELTLSTK